MNAAEIREVVLSILGGIAPEVDLARVRPDADLREELDIDSMDFLRFVVGIAERLGVEIPEADYPRVRTLDGCVEYLAAHGAAPRAQASARTG
jgi:acyl carrier protein